MNIILFIAVGLVLMSFISVFVLAQRLKGLHSEKPHVIPKWILFVTYGIEIIHIVSLIILIGYFFFPNIF